MSVSNEEFAKDKVELKVLGISYSQLQSGAYAMLLAEIDGPYRIPVVIGSAEAQAIAIKIEGVTPPPHDPRFVRLFRRFFCNRVATRIHI